MLEPTAGDILDKHELAKLHAYWRAANYLSVGQIYLYANPLLKTPLLPEHIKPRLLGHWGTTPGLNFVYAHANRVINKYDLNMIYITGPGHGGPAVVANTYLEGSYTELYPEITEDEAGMLKLFKQFSFPGGIPSHTSAQTPGSINEGGELGYCLLHAFGAVFDNPDLIACCVVGDGEAETGPLATSWHGNKFLNPKTDGVVLPILHLNGYKIANPTILSRISHEELQKLFEGYGYKPYFVEGDEPELMHQRMASVMEKVIGEIREIKRQAGLKREIKRPRWPMIILRSPKGWTGPKEVDGKPNTGTFHAHQVPFGDLDKPGHIKLLQDWMLSYAPHELFDAQGRLKQELRALAPKGERRMGANPHANGGLLLKPLDLPDFHQFAYAVTRPGERQTSSTGELGKYLAEVWRRNQHNFRVFSPDENNSNRLQALFNVTDRQWMAERLENDEHLAPHGGVMEILSEHSCEGWLEGYLLTGRHGFFSCYEAFIHIIDSMFNQHAKWLKECGHIPWRKPIASLNILLSSHVWRQDHNGFSHQDPGFIDHAANKKPDIIRIYLPADANTLIAVTDRCLQSRNLINVIVAGKQPQGQWLDMPAAVEHARRGASIWQWAGNCAADEEPDLVIASAGDVPVMESLAAVMLLREHVPGLKIRYVNVVDLMTLVPNDVHPHGLTDEAFDELFTQDKPVIFAFHGYPGLIHRLAYKRCNHANFHVHGFLEEGTTTTPFDMTVLNRLDRYSLVKNTLRWLPHIENAAVLDALMDEKLAQHKQYIWQHGVDMPEIRDWTWQAWSA